MKVKVKFFIALLVFIFSTAIQANGLWHTLSDADQIVSSTELTKARADFVELVKKMNPTVVNVFTTQKISYNASPFGQMGGGHSDLFRLFEDMLNNRGQQFRNQPMERKATALGSGFIINNEGYILTNNHVVNNADTIRVKLFNGKEYDAVLKGVDPETDLALIKINTKEKVKFDYAHLGDSEKVEVGEWVIAIGNPLGLSHTVTSGIISAHGKVIPEISIYNDYIQTDASINQGNSGGPLINTRGEVIGINTAIIRHAGGVAIEGIGFAIPINAAKKVLPKLAKGEKIAHQRGWLGIVMNELSPDIARSLGVQDGVEGVVIAEVVPNSPAAKADLRAYDIITSFDGKPIRSANDLAILVKRSKTDKQYIVELIRKKQKIQKQIVLGNDKEELSQLQQGSQPESKSSSVANYGLYLENLSAATINRYRLHNVKPNQGVLVVQVESNSSAARANIRVGDVILEVNQNNIKNIKDFNSALKSGVNLLKIKRGDHIVVAVIK